ncbi:MULTISPECIES: hypothetical protein [unclassified Streptomyces]|uniref:hypothetical protein n=1 Tax=unclassified Streptomyces TaxID=2593676 RepID=UPI003D8FA05E
MTGPQSVAVQHNGRIDLVSLRTSLPTTERIPQPAENPTTIVNNYQGPVFNASVHDIVPAWNNTNVSQQQANKGGSQA